MTETIQHHGMRPWWRRPPVWVIGIAAALLVIFSIIAAAGKAPLISGSS